MKKSCEDLKFERLNEILGIKEVYLIGSVAKSQADSCSDLDIIVISDNFEGISYFKRKQLVQKYLESERQIDAICLTTDEFLGATTKPISSFKLENKNYIKIWGE
jgi:predicted nucleotidyltransferase